jgi:hypothetical protein
MVRAAPEKEAERESGPALRKESAHTRGGKALAFKPTPMRAADAIQSYTIPCYGWLGVSERAVEPAVRQLVVSPKTRPCRVSEHPAGRVNTPADPNIPQRKRSRATHAGRVDLERLTAAPYDGCSVRGGAEREEGADRVAREPTSQTVPGQQTQGGGGGWAAGSAALVVGGGQLARHSR